VLGMNASERQDTCRILKTFQKQSGATFPILIRTDHLFGIYGRQKKMPLEVIIDQKGRIAHMAHRFDAKIFRSVFRRLLGPTPSVKKSRPKAVVFSRRERNPIRKPPTTRMAKAQVIPGGASGSSVKNLPGKTSKRIAKLATTKPSTRPAKAILRVPYKTFKKAHYSGHWRKGTYRIQDVKRWKKLWKVIHSMTSPVPSLPKLDFQKVMLIGAFHGEYSTAGCKLSIRDILQKSDFLEVQIEATYEDATCLVQKERVQPYHLVLLQKNKLPIRFSWTTHTVSCKKTP